MKAFIVGSINMDMVINVDNLPDPGMTIFGSNFFTNPGGKGANQAVAISKSGSLVYMVGAVGISFGEELINQLNKDNVKTDYIKINNDVSSGVAMIIISHNDNRIILDKGANFKLAKEDIDKAFLTANKGDYVILQLEIPIDIVEYTLLKAKELALITILNPAPAVKLNKEYFKYIDYFIPNQSETFFYTRINPTNLAEAKEASLILKNEGIKNILITLGELGSYFNGDEEHFEKAIKTKVLDTTAAGDTYIGCFVASLMEGKSLKDAMKYATKAASLAISKKGAQQTIPTKEEILNY